MTATRWAVPLLLVAALAGCGGDDVEPDLSTAEPAVEPAPTAATTTATRNEDLFLTGVRERGGPAVAALTDAQLLEIGEGACSAIDQGVQEGLPPHMAFLAYMSSASGSEDPEYLKEAFGTISGMGVVALCPEYRDDLTER